jgi:hypothetical protein
MKKITEIIKKLPKPYSVTTLHRYSREKTTIAWYYHAFFYILYVAGINVIISKHRFFTAFTIKLTWLCVILMQLHSAPISFVEGFIAYVIMLCYLFHFFDIFMLFTCAMFIPNGHILIEDK